MQNKKSLLILIAQPAHETLHFFEGLQQLRAHFEMDIMCLTFGASSDEGRELIRIARDMDIKVCFQNSKDKGYNSLLLHVDRKLAATLECGRYHAVITHPPHDGESSHPYHLQCFHVARRLCATLNIAFGFFSDKKIDSVEVEGHLYRLNLRHQFKMLWDYVLVHIKIRKYPLKNFSEILNELRYFVKIVLSPRKYALFTSDPDKYLYLEQHPNSGFIRS